MQPAAGCLAKQRTIEPHRVERLDVPRFAKSENLTGMLSWFLIASTTPPWRAVELGEHVPVMFTALLKFSPAHCVLTVVALRTRMTSQSAFVRSTPRGSSSAAYQVILRAIDRPYRR
jgi:hypothetical protein